MSSTLDALLSSKSSLWKTPGRFLDLVRQVGPIVLDPATSDDNPTRAQYFYTERMNGLIQPWPVLGLVFVNPPYGAHLSGPVDPWKLVTKKDRATKQPIVVGMGTGWAARMAQHTGEGLYLVPSRPETEWGRALRRWCDWRLDWSSDEYGARINFDKPDSSENDNGSTFPSSIFYKGPNVASFFRAFEKHGEMVPGTRTQRALVQHAVAAGWRP